MDTDCLLRQVEAQEITARQFGFYWENIHQLMDQIRSECKEVEEAWDHNDLPHLQEELGDLIQAAVSLAVFCNFDPHQTLTKAIQKFQKRYDTVVQLAQNDGLSSLEGQSFEVLMRYWDLAKKSL